jgi:hypothetical protein
MDRVAIDGHRERIGDGAERIVDRARGRRAVGRGGVDIPVPCQRLRGHDPEEQKSPTAEAAR